jgi:hypothetical protein
VSPVKYVLSFHNPEDDIPHSHSRDTHKSDRLDVLCDGRHCAGSKRPPMADAHSVECSRTVAVSATATVTNLPGHSLFLSTR